ncbi:chitobiase/beta-hexosaminidase C-terminal domain-containing protein [Prevotella sp. E9-3]|uniref:chitobiase/beta-hexosaminidase C-terminal domain-containing protein n=1 Tax=Prevotella sp. E9-3 TaxID=2913621 RepID=UPI001EDC7C55|nr:chitobiase/beta-hexosaminidase C-terminal domain-containing protein [Prevotella sp. E9-3]UKK47955.1 chitobiase/beta-hexosaminidase C-terminal domain-containing protein [Prevotella sp. E9-3]
MKRLMIKQIVMTKNNVFGTIVMALLMLMGTTGTWGQTDYSGTYYIASGGKSSGNGNSYTYDSSNPSNNFYLCPTEGWCYYQATNDFTDTDNGQPFLTTYKCRSAAYHSGNASDAIWIIEKAPASNYYYIIQKSTGKYLVSNGQIRTTDNPDRIRVHLETIANPETEGNKVLFEFNSPSGTYIEISPKGITDGTSSAHKDHDKHKWLTVNNGNYTNLVGNSGKIGGPTGYANTCGIICLYSAGDVNAPFYLEDVPIPTPTYTVNADGTVEISCSEAGTVIHYTLDGTDPTASSAVYSSALPSADVLAVSSVKAIAVRTIGSQKSEVATLPVITYNYHIVNVAKNIAVTSTEKHPAGYPLTSGYDNIPTAIRSPYISDEEIKFYRIDGVFDAGELIDENKIEETPTESDNIYITYTKTHLGKKFVKLSGSSPYNIKNTSGQYLYDNGSHANGSPVTAETNSATNAEAYVTNNNQLWYFSGDDPYDLKIKNAESSTIYLTTSSSAPTWSDASVSFVLTGQSDGADASHKSITLKNLANGETVTLAVNTVVLPRSYTLIDMTKNVIVRNLQYDEEDGFILPEEWRSPLVDYHYWNADAFTQATAGTPDEPFVFVTPAPTEITNATQVTSNNVIYVTYTLKADNTIDLDGRNLLKDPEKVGGTTYMLEFQTPNTDDYKFYQEDGKDGVMTEKRRAVYPYSNGDATLYVYGNERWEEQLASGASTRTRWLWYLEPVIPADPTKAKLDPYHVRVSSYQNQTSYKIDDDNTRNFHSYLITYKPTDYSEVVTGVTNNNPLAHGGDEDDEAITDLPKGSEYMLLGTSTSSLKLVTFDEITGGAVNGVYGTRQTVHSLEQYWKNNPTVQGKLTTNKVTAVGRRVELTDDQKTEIKNLKIGEENLGWHVYKAWANSAPWVHNHDEATTGGAPTTSKKFLEEEHVFQTIGMGDGSFRLVPTEIKPMLILLDQHGWEIVRLPLPSGPTDPKRAEIYANIHKYSSPMVARYHFWKTGSKALGYHKFTVSDYATVSATDLTEYTADELGRADITNPLTPPNLPNYESQALVSGKERDWYVTYDVEDEYASAYVGADTEDNTSPSQYLIKQGGNFAQLSGTSLSSTSTEPDLENVPENMQWYLRPNFDIDEEMGYNYEGAYEEKTKEETEKDYFDSTREDWVSTWSNGFDPYNVQIQSVSNTARYFTANTTGAEVGSAWTGTSSSITTENLAMRQTGIIGHDQVKMQITNATFMVVDDGHGNMRLMPRFDNTKVMQSFTTLAAPAEQTASVNENQIFTLKLVPQTVHRSSEIKAMGGKYILASDFTASGSIGTRAAPFKGTIEGQINQSFSVSAPFIAFAEDAVIKNVIIESATVSGDTVGAIVNQAKGNTRIYNCGVNGGTVSGTDIAGSIVGHLDGYSRVINCYSYADITGGSYVGGIVGYNNYLSSTFNEANIRTMVMNCMFYGDITGGSNKAPIYNGFIISNKDATGLGNYNYFLAEKPYVQNNQINTYNCALMAETRFLQRFEFYRLLLNSHLELAAWYATGSYNNKDEMMKWVLETADRNISAPKLYPVLKAPGKYPSIMNIDAENAPTSGDRNTGKVLGSLTVNIQMGDGAAFNRPAGASITTGSLTLNITDKDYARFNFNYRKVQLPYYNDVGTKNYTGNRVVTGWKIVSITGGTAGSYTTGDDATADAEGNITSAPYNFADRNCTNKDLYGKSGRIFNQGAYWDVPEGVTAITIEPYWAKAAYLADAYPDVVYNQSMDTKYDVPYVGGGEKYKNGSKYSIAGEEQVVYTAVGNAKDALDKDKTVYDCAIVLVGNAHNIGISSGESDRSYTIMSADFDNDNEPDYSYILRFNNRSQTHPVRVDFLNIPGLGMAQKSTGGTGSYNFGIMQPIGWFESTNTSLFRVTQLEYDRKNRGAAPLILQGGVIEQWVSGQNDGAANETTYFHVGGNVWFKEFHRGTHQDKQLQSKHVPVSVTGGDYDEFYLTGLYRGDVTSYNDNVECYINGGRFGTVVGAAQEGIGNATNHTNGNIIWQIQNADIDEFYGGGLNAAKPVEGNITTVITGSHVTLFCGGPKFGDMNTGKTVITKATDCTFGTYFGAGYGGNSYSRYAPGNKIGVENINWNSWLSSEYKQNYNATYDGVSTQFTYQFIPRSDNTSNVARILIDFVKFSLATTRNVTSTLTGCTVTGNFYGGGSLGKVDGNVTSTLTNCRVKGNAFGAGFSASLPTVEVDAIGFDTEPYYYTATGTYREGIKAATTTYTWQHRDKIDAGIDKTNQILYTTEDLTTLGAVTGKATLNIEGNTLVEGYVFDEDGNPTTQTGGVFGGGDASAALGDTEVNVEATGRKEGAAYNAYNVFGGGNVARVGGTTTVNMTNGIVSQRVFGGGNEADVSTNSNVAMSGGTVLQGVYGGCNVQGVIGGDATVTITGGTIGNAWSTPVPDPLPDMVFGGGKGEPTLVSGNVTVNVGKSDHSGAAIVWGNVYGGSALGNTNATKPADALVFGADKTTNVNLYAGTINGNVFGGGLGRKAVAADAEHGIEAVTAVESFVGGDVNVLLDGAKLVQTFTGEGENRMPLTAQIFGANNLNGTPKGHVKVHVMRTVDSDKSSAEALAKTRTQRNTYDVAAVYGGGNQADYVPTNATLDPNVDGNKTLIEKAFAEVIIDGCDATSIEYVYGGGNAAAVPATEVAINGSYIINQVFGGGNGKSTDTFTNPGANIGIYNNGTTNYGTGITFTKLVGGKINEVYGGSNTLGNVRGGTTLKRETPGEGACDLEVGEIYGAGQVAPMDGDVNIILECMPESFVDAVYGGAKNAVVNGDVRLTVTSGKYGRVFGGNNEGGSINGSITVNAYEDGCKPLIIGELYGGGFKAPYSIYGCTENSGTWTANTEGTLNFDQEAAGRAAVEVNVYSCTSIGKVFGGGYQAPVIGNTHVYINTMQGIVDGKKQTYETTPEKVYIGKIGQVFGGGNAATVTGNTTIDIGTATVNKEHSTGEDAEKIGVNIVSGSYLKPDNNADGNATESIDAGVYGGGYSADVEGSATLNIGTVEQNQGINIAGNIFGGGFGESTHVTGDVTVNIGKNAGTNESPNYVGYANITGDVYGGSAKGKVNSSLVSSVETATEGKTTQVNLYGGTITGSMYGGGLGDLASLGDGHTDVAADVYGPVAVNVYGGNVDKVFGCNNVLGTPKSTVAVAVNGGTIDNSVYGGGNQAAYTAPAGSENYPTITVVNGTILENVFGGGLGLTATVTGNPQVTIGDNVEGHAVAIKQSVYGGGEEAQVAGNTVVTLNSGTIGTPKDGETVYGGATYGNIYGGGLGRTDNAVAGMVQKNTNINIVGGTVLHNIYGGGAYGSVGSYTYNESTKETTCAENTGTANITVTGGTIGTDGHENGMVFGASRGDVAAPEGTHDRLAWVNNTNVVIGTSGEGHGTAAPEPQIKGSVYGGGENGHTYKNTSVAIHSGTIGTTEAMPSDPADQKGAKYPYRGNVYGGGCGTDKYYSGTVPAGHTANDGRGDTYNPLSGIVQGTTTVVIDGGHIVHNVYGAGAMGSVDGSTNVTISGGTIGANGGDGGFVYAAARGDAALTDANQAYVGSTALTISGGTIWDSAFGGGQSGIVKGNVSVTVSGGTVKNDVYGGGALANTNTDNWDTPGSATKYVEATGLNDATYYNTITIPVGESVVGYYTYTGSAYVAATGTAVKDVTYYQRLTGAPIAGYYTKEGDVYTLQTSGTADTETTYYKKVVVGSWATGKNSNETGTVNKTTVILTGGSVGNVYGGGLGNSTTAANVYGDVKVTVNKPDELTSTGGTGIGFSHKEERVTFGGKEYLIPLTGRVFGCNNINGTPTGNVRVEVYSTRQADENGNVISNSEHSPNSSNNRYEIQGVYGGGNLSDYLPADGKGTSVYVDGCDVTSIEKVYGGGNSASVPSSHVTVNGSYDIGYAFGGGNGGDLVKKDGTWYDNDGAIVIGTAHIAPIGGKIGAVFGGSDAKGNCGSVEIDKSQTNPDCALKIIRMYGAGNEADVDNVNIIISSCSGGSEAEIEYVYGGSYNANVAHDVTLTITAGKFKNIYGGNDRTGSIGGNITVNIEETDNCMPITIQNLLGGGYQAPYPGTNTKNGTEITTPGKITVNVKSATHIDNIYGGSFKADVNGDTEVNINMTKGYFAGKTYSGEAIADDVGTIGNVYGGGNQGVVRGNATVNIGTATTVGYVTEPIHLRTEPGTELPKTDGLYVVPVVGARITGNVFGGGNEANVNSSTAVNIGTAVTNVSVGGSVYGGGSQADVLKNTNVTMAGGYVFDGVYGGGLHGSVGTAAVDGEGNVLPDAIVYHTGTEAHAGCIGKIVNYKANTGKSTVVVTGGQVGPVETALADGGMKNTGHLLGIDGPVDVGFVFGAGRGEVEDPATDKDADFRTFVKETDVTVGGTAFIMASVYGGGENGRVANDTHVTIEEDCQIGCGEGKVTDGKPVRYTTAQWTGEDASNFTECASWYFKSPYWPYDPYGGDDAGLEGTDGHTYYGNVFGGGSGYFPYKRADGTHDWLRSAGAVYGNTVIDITGGHILNCVYGGNELTDVTGKATVKMTGGTLGVPRTDSQMKNHPVTCYLFGGGKGDQRTHFNTWTNVGSTEVKVSGTARIFGSVFGGAEDGHVLGNTTVNIGGEVKIDLNGDGDTTDEGETFIAQSGLKIGTTGTSYVDGNVFGGGRGFSGLALTAGSVHGNIELTINGGTMLGSVYGGGRLASVGIDMVDATLADGSPNPAYGLLKDDTDSETCGHITVSITGGTIGNDVAGAEYGGNVFGGSMGRLTKLDGTTNPQWPKLAASKLTNVTISGGTIKRNVYGGSEYGIVRNRATVNVSGGTINGSVFGSGRGSEKTEKQTIAVAGYDNSYYTFTPMLWAGCVSGSTFVNISGGTVKKNVYGGGELASVGLIDFVSDASGKFTNMTKHESLTNGFGLSWPYEFHYHAAAPSDLPAVGGKEIGGKATVTIIGGKIGDASNAESGYVFGGGMGKPMERYTEAFMANVRETEVSIKYASTATALSDDNCITGAVYGGGENGHVYENSAVNITGGLIGYSVYGGGKGIDKYKATLKNWKNNGATTYETDIYSITAGKVYGNTSVTMSGGHVMRNVYGGGYMASVGKGNYAGGADDYSDFTSEKFGHMSGYGETITGNLWDGISENSQAFLNSGKATVTITGGTVGTPVGTAEDEFGGLPTGNVIGGSKGEPAPNIFNMPVHEYNPTFHVGNINEAEVIIGDKNNIGVGPRIYASVYGGGQDGHMRRDSKVTIYGGEIGLSSSDISSKYANDGIPANTLQWEHRGNVYGSGSGIGKFEYDYNGNGTTGADQYYEFDSDGDGTAEKHYEVGMSHLAGCVARFSEVNILGGTIHRSVYGGGSVAGTGMPKFYGQNYEPYKKGDTAEGHGPGKQSQNTVTISGGTIGEVGYGGNVFGASRGEAELVAVENPMFATAIWTEVNIKPYKTEAGIYDYSKSPVIYGNVYGGGELGSVKKDTKVSLTGGEIKHNAYGGGKGIKADVGAVEANIGGNTTVELNRGVANGVKGCIVSKVFGCNDQNGTPKGHALVHVYATQHKNQLTIGSKYAKFKSMEGGYTLTNYKDNTDDDDLKKIALSVLTTDEIEAFEGQIDGGADATAKTAALNKYIEAIADKKYDVLGVYGGGDLARYEPTDIRNENTEVIIDGCDVTSIKQVYGGGNAASTPANNVRINAAYEIHEAFGGGNGDDAYELNGKWYENPGANVGYYATFHHDTTDPEKGTTQSNPYPRVENDNAKTKENRRANYSYGKGTATLVITGGYVHSTFGGSNERGNVREEVVTIKEGAGVCPMTVDRSYPAGNHADTDGTAKLESGCQDAYQAAIYGGANAANVYSDVVIDITNGSYGKIYGGNDTSGRIYGSITINVHEEGCKPIVIGEIYAGGKGVDAPYSIYGYEDNGSIRTKAEYEALSPEKKAEIRVNRDPQINIISATKIGTIYGGGDEAQVIGSPSINVNMKNGYVPKKYVNEKPADFSVGDHVGTDHEGLIDSYTVKEIDGEGKAILELGTIGSIYGGGRLADVQGDTHVEIGTGKWLNASGQRETTDADGKVYTYNTATGKWDWILKVGDEITSSGTVDVAPVPARNAATITGNVFGGGKGKADTFECEKAMVGVDDTDMGSTSVVIANGSVGGSVYGGGEIGRVKKDTEVTVGVEGEVANDSKFKPEIVGNVFGAGQGVETHGYSGLTRGNSTVTIQGLAKIKGSVYGGGEKATVGQYDIDVNGKPTTPISGGVCTVTIKDNAEIGPDNMVMNNTTTGKPDDAGHVFGAGKGVIPGDYTYADNEHKPQKASGATLVYIDTEDDYIDHIETLGLASETHVTVGGNAFVKGSVYGGSENGYVQTDTHVTIEGTCQIGAGYDTDHSLSLPKYAEEEFIDPKVTPVTEENVLQECNHWPYGEQDGEDKFAPYDPYTHTVGDDGHTFYGNVFGGGSGYYPYASGKWHFKAGSVGGNTTVNITGGHILTNIYGGNEMTNVKGDTHVTFGGTATLGVPRTLAQIAAHPVSCYLFGAGKGDQRVFFNMQTNVKNVNVDVTGGTIYGSVFGGGEDGHVLGNVTMNIGTAAVGTEGQTGYVAASGPTIGTWGTSYVEGNVFGGGRGFAGDALTAGVVCGNVDMNIMGGTMLGSIYGGGRLGSIGTHLEPSNHANYGKLIPDNSDEDYETGDDDVHSGSTHGYVTINISGGTIGNNNEYIIPQAGNIPSDLDDADPKNWETADWTTWKEHNNVPNTDYVYDKDLGFVRLTHTKGGNVFAGAMGRMYALDGTTPLTRWYDLGMVKSTRLTITGGTIKSNVYGGGELGWTAGKHKHSNTALTATDCLSTEIVIRGGTIGTEVKEAGVTRYTFGSVYGGGYGNAKEKLSDVAPDDAVGATNPKFIAGRVVGATSVRMEDGWVKGSIFGGGEVANVGLGFYSYKSDNIGGTKGGFTKDDSGIAKTGETITDTDIAQVSTYVDVSGGTVGIEPITVSGKLRCFGGATMGNVYGGGSGNRTIVRCGLVLGNSNVSISQAEGKTTRIYHNVYGGGSFGSVGDYEYESQEDPVIHTEKVYGVQKMHTAGTGEATVSITGGTIGSNGHENGMVFGSSRGDIANPHSRDNYMAWVNNATVTIGTKGGTYATPTVKGSVYGSGENGHTFGNTVVTVNSGTVGVPPGDPIVVPDPSAPNDPEKATTYYGANYPFRGNVYGGGCGTDTYVENNEVKYNPEAGIVRGNTTVNINGGLIAHSVYGAGSMASVGTIGTDPIKHDSAENGFALSWPYEFTFADNTGKATVNINGGHIGVQLTDGNIEIKGDGDVYGSARGEAGDRYKTAHFAYVRETEVNVNFPDTCTATFANYSTDLGKWCVTGSVHGSGENGYVYGDTHVTLKKGLIGHSLYGAGKGNGTYTKRIKRIYDAEEYDAQIYSLIAGRVMGNTYVTMTDGHVGRNVYGGGNMGSVGKGNYAGGTDDYNQTGYGEAINGKLWTSTTEGDNAWHFLNSGKTHVTVTGGIVGYIDETDPTRSMKNGLPYGNVFGGSAGEAAPNVPLNLDPRYEFCPAFFSGYVNETDVTIGTLGQDNDDAGQTGKAPRILGSVYGGGQDGHVRRLTHVTVNSGVIGMPFTEANKTLLQQLGINDPQWLYRGCVYGGGSGISEFKYDFNGDGDYDDTYNIDGVEYKEMGFSNSSGSVTHFTTVDVLGGLVYRAVLGGGSLGSVGAPKINQPNYAERRTATAAEWGGQSLNQVNVGGGKVDGNVVKATIGEPTGVAAGYGGNVFGGGRGEAGLGSDFGTSIWTQVNVKNGANILGNVYGGGNAGPVLKDTEVKIGE